MDPKPEITNLDRKEYEQPELVEVASAREGVEQIGSLPPA